ncbi:hypothetical protein LINGRAHAP2_LOCUS4848, partial [Linum grandiflorum]
RFLFSSRPVPSIETYAPTLSLCLTEIRGDQRNEDKGGHPETVRLRSLRLERNRIPFLSPQSSSHQTTSQIDLLRSFPRKLKLLVLCSNLKLFHFNCPCFVFLLDSEQGDEALLCELGEGYWSRPSSK